MKPNEHELAEAAGLTVPVTLPDAVRASRALLADGAQGAVVSLGQRGLLGVRPGSAVLAVPPTQRGNPVGAGDAAVAALVDGQLAGRGPTGCAGRRRCPPRRCGSPWPASWTQPMSPNWKPLRW